MQTLFTVMLGTQEFDLFSSLLLVILVHSMIAAGLFALASMLLQKDALEFQILASFSLYLSCLLIGVLDFPTLSFYLCFFSGTVMFIAAMIHYFGRTLQSSTKAGDNV